MRISFVSPPPNLSGGERVIAVYADRLQARGHDVTVVATRPRVPDGKAYVKALARGQVPKRPPKVTHYDRMQAQLRVLDHDGPVTAADLPDADVVVATWWETAFAVATLPPQKGRKVYFVQGHEVFDSRTAHLGAGSYFLPLRKITISGWLQETMSDLYGDADVALIPNSVDTDLFHAPPRGRQPAPTVGFMYSQTRSKGADVALHALEEVRRTHPDLRVVSFGNSPVDRELPLPPGARYARAPAQEMLRSLYAQCDVFLSASRSEGFGLPVLEAMACRTPVVATRTGCSADVIVDGAEGIVAEVDDADGLADGLRRVLDQPEAAWKRMSKAAFDRATSYTWDDATTLFEDALRFPQSA